MIKKYRLQAGLTQKELAEKAGLGKRTVEKLDKNVTKCNFSTLCKVAKVLDIDLNDLKPN